MKLSIAAFHTLARDIAGSSLPAPMLPAISREDLLVGETSKPLPLNTAFIELKSSDDAVIVVKLKAHVIDRIDIEAGETKFFGVQAGWCLTLEDPLS